MRTIARFMDARNTAEGKFLSVLLSVLLVFSFLNVTMLTDYANATDEEARRPSSSSPPPSPGTRRSPLTRPTAWNLGRRRRARSSRSPPSRDSPSPASPRRR